MLGDQANGQRPIYIGPIQNDPNPPVNLSQHTSSPRGGGGGGGYAWRNIDSFKLNSNASLHGSRRSLERLRFPRTRNHRDIRVLDNDPATSTLYIKGTLNNPQGYRIALLS